MDKVDMEEIMELFSEEGIERIKKAAEDIVEIMMPIVKVLEPYFEIYGDLGERILKILEKFKEEEGEHDDS